MMVCGEDLGMIPACVKGVLEGCVNLALLTHTQTHTNTHTHKHTHAHTHTHTHTHSLSLSLSQAGDYGAEDPADAGAGRVRRTLWLSGPIPAPLRLHALLPRHVHGT